MIGYSTFEQKIVFIFEIKTNSINTENEKNAVKLVEKIQYETMKITHGIFSAVKFFPCQFSPFA